MIRMYWLLPFMISCASALGTTGVESNNTINLPPGQCTLYQKVTFQNDPSAYASCADVAVPYDNITPDVTSTGFMWARTVPMCRDGTDGPCPGEEIRCIDGTRPYYHVDKAVHPSNRWIVYFQGGGSCGNDSSGGAGIRCMTAYTTPDETMEMSTRPADTSRPAVPARIRVEGILDETTPFFSDFNRVKIHKCSYDRYAGNRTYDDMANGTTLFFHGRRIIQAVFDDLNGSRGIVSGPGDGSLPKLDKATQIAVVAQSGGALGLTQNAEFIKTKLDAMTNAVIRFVFDARLDPNGAGETHFERDSEPGAGFYDSDYSGESIVMNDTNAVVITRSKTTYEPGGEQRSLYDTWGNPLTAGGPEAIMDASCFATHAADPTLCYDDAHVASHHLSVDRFIYQTLRDVNHRDNVVPWIDRVDSHLAKFAFVPDHSPANQFMDAFMERVVYTAGQVY